MKFLVILSTIKIIARTKLSDLRSSLYLTALTADANS